MKPVSFLFYILTFFSLNGYGYSTNCELSGGQAHGYVSSEQYKSITISGYVTFKIYDKDFDLIDEERTYTYEYIYNDTELIESVNVPDRAAHCFLDVSEAVEEEDGEDDSPIPAPPSDEQPYAYCELSSGEAHGYVKAPDYESITISGTVTFIFYDSEFNEIDRESTYTYEYIYGDTELVESVNAPSEATRCSFDISEAI